MSNPYSAPIPESKNRKHGFSWVQTAYTCFMLFSVASFIMVFSEIFIGLYESAGIMTAAKLVWEILLASFGFLIVTLFSRLARITLQYYEMKEAPYGDTKEAPSIIMVIKNWSLVLFIGSLTTTSFLIFPYYELAFGAEFESIVDIAKGCAKCSVLISLLFFFLRMVYFCIP